MAKKVTLYPGGQSFQVERRETILDAAIRAGVALDYGCSSGNCGQCRARLVSGQVERIRRQDYVFSAAERSQGYLLLCTYTAVTDVAVEAQAAGAAREIPEQRLRAKVRKLETLGDDLLILGLQTPRTQRLRFLAGQYATFVVPGLGEYAASIASCPCDDRHLEFHIRRLEGDAFSDYFFGGLRVSDNLDLRAPSGSFVLDEGSRRPLVLIAFDTGFAPIKSLLEHATARESDRQIHLYWIACTPEEHYQDNLCRSWEDALDEFSYTALTFGEFPDAASGRGAAVDDAIEGTFRPLLGDHPELDSDDVYIAAPRPLLDAARRLLAVRSPAASGQRHFEPVRGNLNVSCLTETDSPA